MTNLVQNECHQCKNKGYVIESVRGIERIRRKEKLRIYKG
jgi:hypothetical protein